MEEDQISASTLTGRSTAYRRFGRTGLEISRIGCGGWQLGGGELPEELRPRDDDARIALVHRAVESGVNWIDTAPAYGYGHSELVIGRALRGLSDRPVVITKCGNVWDERGRMKQTLRRDSIRRECEESLRRLGANVIDVYMIHWPLPDEEFEEGWAALAELKSEGKVAHIGGSNFSVEQIRRCEEIAPVEALQLPYSLVRPQLADEVFPYCTLGDIGLIIYGPVGAGLLSGTMTRERISGFTEGDARNFEPQRSYYVEPHLTRNLEIADRLRATGLRPSALAIAWTLAHPAVTGAIVGLRNQEHLDDALLAVTELDRLQEVLRDLGLLATSESP